MHRFRVAPQPEAAIDRKLAEGRLIIRKASLVSAVRNSEHFLVTLRDRRTGKIETQPVDTIALATGPAHQLVFAENPLLASLRQEGMARPDLLGLGIDVDLRGRAIGAGGNANPDILVAGPLARGTFGELMGLPDIAEYATRIAGEAVKRIAELEALSGRSWRYADQR